MNEKKERIILDVAYQPQVRTKTDTQRLMLNVILALLPAVAVSVWQFGLHPLVVIASSVLSAVFFEWAIRKFRKQSATIGDLSAVVTGLLLALTLPPTSPWWLPVIGTFFGIVVVKQLYGGIGKNFLNPALAGRAFLLASYAMLMGRFAAPAAMNGIEGVDAISAATPLAFLYGSEGMPAYYNVKAMFLGFDPRRHRRDQRPGPAHRRHLPDRPQGHLLAHPRVLPGHRRAADPDLRRRGHEQCGLHGL